MAVNYSYPSSYTLKRITQDFIERATLEDPIFKLFPLTPINSAKMRWIIRDNYRGLMQIRGMGGEPTRVNKLGQKVNEEEPGVFGEYMTLDETEITNRAAWTVSNQTTGDFSAPVNVSDLVTEGMDYLDVRRSRRMKQACWNFALLHTLSLTLPEGGIGLNISYTGQTLTLAGAALFTAPATAAPLSVFRSLQPTYGFGTSNVFGGLAEAWMNTFTKNLIMGNTNPADIGGKRVVNGATVNDLPTFNRILLDNDVPQIMIWDDGYVDDTGTFQLYIPNNYILVVGKRPNGDTPGEFQMTRNAVNPNFESEAYGFVKDMSQGPARTVPPKLELHSGFSGGPVVSRPTQLVTVIVG